MLPVEKRFESLSLEQLYKISFSRMQVFVIEQEILYQDFDFKDQKSVHFFFEEDGKIVSYLRLIDPGVKYKETSIGRVLTLKEYRGRGLARRLMLHAINYAKCRGDVSIRIEAQEYLEAFYKSIGFRSVSAPFILEGISHVSMILEL